MGWYAIFVETGYEDTVKDIIENIKPYFENHISFELIVPKRKIYERKNGVKKSVIKTVFPGYILIHTDFIETFYLNVRKSPHIIKFLKSGSYFTEIGIDEITVILQMINENGIIEISSALWTNNKLTVLAGPLKGKENAIKKIDKRNGRVKSQFIINSHSFQINLGIDIYTTPGY